MATPNPLRYYGSKWSCRATVLQAIYQHIPSFHIYCEPCCGGTVERVEQRIKTLKARCAIIAEHTQGVLKNVSAKLAE